MAAQDSEPEQPDNGRLKVPECRHEPRCAPRPGVFPRYVRLGEYVRLDCDRPVLIGVSCGSFLVVRCGSRSSLECVPCSWRYRRLLERRIDSGMGREGAFYYLLTLSAPGAREHRMPSGDLCPCTPPGGVDLATWNPSAGRRWNRFRTELRRDVEGLQFSRHVELQQRGAIHLHIIVRSPEPLDSKQLRRLAIRCGFGHECDLAPITSAKGLRAYVTKAVTGYVTKAVSERDDVPWTVEVLDEDTGEILAQRKRATYRITSASRRWGMTIREIREAQAAHVERHRMRRAIATLIDAGLLSEPAAAIGPAPPPT